MCTVLRSYFELGDAGDWSQIILLLPYSTHIPKAFLRVFVRKMKGKNSSRGDDKWTKLAEQVDEYTFKAGSDCSDDIDFDDASDLEQDIEELDNNMPESNKLVDAELDRE